MIAVTRKASTRDMALKSTALYSPQTKSIEVYGISSGRLVLLEEHKLGERLLSPLLPGFTPALMKYLLSSKRSILPRQATG